jgi:perosamine synthetase
MKRRLFGWYRDELGGVPGVTLNAEPAGTKNSYWMVTVVLDPSRGIEKDELMKRLDAREIDTRPFFHPLSSLPAYAKSPEAAAARTRNRVANAVSRFGVNLPSALNLTRADVARVGEALRSAIA